VVHEIAELIVEKPTFIVFEDLNKGFKRLRQKIEKQVYQKLELAVAKKFNNLTFKEIEIGEIGSISNGLQLTPPVENYQDMEYKQVGIMLYTRANYTSVTDPETG
jgi:CRISPR-associated protein Cpf1